MFPTYSFIVAPQREVNHCPEDWVINPIIGDIVYAKRNLAIHPHKSGTSDCLRYILSDWAF